MVYVDGMTATTVNTSTALHFGLLDDAANDMRTETDMVLAVARCLEAHGYSSNDLVGCYDEGDSFREWGEHRWDADEAIEVFGSNDSYHGKVFLSDRVTPEMAETIFQHLVDEAIADPTADCSPSMTVGTCAWAFTTAEDFSAVLAQAAE